MFTTAMLCVLRFPSVQLFMMVDRQEYLESIHQAFLGGRRLLPIIILVKVVDQFSASNCFAT